MRYILLGAVFAILAGFIPRYSSNETFGLIVGLLIAEIISMRRRISSMEHQQSINQSHQATGQRERAAPCYEESSAQPHPSCHQNLETHTDQDDHTSQDNHASSLHNSPFGAEHPADSTAYWEQEHPADRTTDKDHERSSSISESSREITASIRKITDNIKAFFTTGNVVLKLGIIIIFFGVSFLLKYAAQRNLFPVELRVASVVAGGIAMLVTGWSMRSREQKNGSGAARLQYGVVLQGGGIGILYLTVFTASRLYPLLPDLFSMVIMVMLVAFSGALAVMQNSRSLAILGILGGFMAPVLISTGRGSHVMLFSYYALLNCGILGIAWFKAWRELNLIGFAFTFVISAIWGARYYKPHFFSTTEPFLALFFLFYVAISVLFAHRQPPKLKGFIDGPLVFGLPLVGFGLQSGMVHNIEYGLAITALTLALFYIALATLLWNRLVEGMRMLTEAFIAIGVVFGTLAIPFALDGRWTSTAWALEGSAMVWVGLRQKRVVARLFGIVLQIGAGVAFLSAASYPYGYPDLHYNVPLHYPDLPSNSMLFINHLYLGSLFMAIAGLFSSYYMVCNREKLRRWENYLHTPLLLWGLAWWFGGGVHEIDQNFSGHDKYHALLLYSALSCQLLSMVARRLSWDHLTFSMMGFLPLMLCTLALELLHLFGHSHLFAHWGAAVWGTAFAVQYGLLWQSDKQLSDETDKHLSGHRGMIFRVPPWCHLITLWILIFILSLETVWAVGQLVNPLDHSTIWSRVWWGIVPALFILLLIRKGELLRWPTAKHAAHYLGHGVDIPALMLVLWILRSNLYQGDPVFLPYIPIINPLELSQIFVLTVLVLWAFRESESRGKSALLLLLLFVWLNFVTGRVVHFYFDIDFTFHDLTESVIFQAAISILWGVISLFTTAFAARTGRRKLWFCGAVLLALLVLKLFTVDLSGIRTIARIISFLAVGGLMLLIGYLSPIPPDGQKVER